jgi:uncharacterized protein YggE
MTRKQLVASLAVAVLLVTAGCAGAIGNSSESPADGNTASAADAQQQQPAKSVRVSASGEVTAEPDRAVLTVGVEATADDAETVRQRLSENVSRMRSALEEMGIDDDQIQTEHYTIREDHESRRNEGPTRYTGIHAFRIEINDTDSVGTVIETAVDNGGTDVGRVSFTLSEETREELREQALSNAMDNARSDAEVLAENADLTITGVTSASTGNVHVRPYRAEAHTAAADAGGTSIESGPVSVTAQVQVTYNATDA